jgi:hypothetical protein
MAILLVTAAGCYAAHDATDGAVDRDAAVDGALTGGRPDWASRRPCSTRLASFVSLDGECDGQRPCFADLQSAADAAQDRSTIWVFPGTYTPRESHVLRSTETPLCVRSIDGPAVTILDGQGRGTVVWAGYRGPLWLEGFTITGCGSARPSDVLDGYAVAIGGWEELVGWIVGNIFEGNTEGEGVILFSTSQVAARSDIYIAGNTIRRNSTSMAGSAAIDINAGTGYRETGLVRIENNLVARNIGMGAIAHSPALSSLPIDDRRVVEVVNNTVIGNAVGLALPVDDVVIHNNLAVDNHPDVTRLEYAERPSVRNNWFGDAPAFAGTNGNLSGDPALIDPLDGDYRLAPGSGARSAGTPDAAPRFDLDGLPRDETRPDIGAYEAAD